MITTLRVPLSNLKLKVITVDRETELELALRTRILALMFDYITVDVVPRSLCVSLIVEELLQCSYYASIIQRLTQQIRLQIQWTARLP